MGGGYGMQQQNSGFGGGMGSNPMGGGAMPTFQANIPLGAMTGMGGPTPNNNFGTINNQFINLNNN